MIQEFLWTIGRNLDADIQLDDSWEPARKGSGGGGRGGGGGEQKKERKSSLSRRSSLVDKMKFFHL